VRLVTAAQIKTSAYGDAERNVRELFRAARRAAPCVIVLDDADDLLPDRNKVDGAVASAERGIVNTFLQELEGWRGRPEGVFVILTTNRFENHLDEAAKSRLALHVRVPYPCTREETAALVSTFAKEYGYDLTDIEKPLVERFCAAVIPDAETDASTADGRRLAKANLFGPREIRGGMRFLLGESGTAGPYRPNLDDLKRMNDYYAHLPRSFDGEPRS
jgi:SpoVK/Ycf46/Vps4 family AAA+-type ATPase